MFDQLVAAAGLAGLGAAELEHVSAGRFAPEVMIECDDPVHFRARQVQLLRDQRRGLLRHTAERLLHGMQDRQHRPFAIIEFCNDAACAIFVPRLRDGHDSGSLSHSRILPNYREGELDQWPRMNGLIGNPNRVA